MRSNQNLVATISQPTSVQRANALISQRKFAQALNILQAELRAFGESAPLLEMIGQCLQHLGHTEEAIKIFEVGMRLDPSYAANFKHRAFLAHVFEKSDPRIFHLKALQADPSDKATLVQFLWASLARSDWDAVRELGLTPKEMRTLVHGKSPSSPWFLLPLMDDPEASLKAQRQRQTNRLKQLRLKSPKRAALPVTAADGRIRIGYYSNDFYDHATLRLFSGVLRHHDRSKFELHCMNFGQSDALSQENLGRFDQVHEIQHLSDREITALARKLGLDIAVDLKGETAGSRCDLFLLGQAPVQINYLGYPGTMGSLAYDYMIADHTVIPKKYEKFYTEKVIRLPTCYLPVDDWRCASLPPTRTELGLPEDAVVLACLNDPYKISSELFEIWIEALEAVPDAVLWLWDGNADSKANLRERFEAAGLNPSRLIFAERLAFQDHITRLAQADLYLDTLYCNAHTLAAEAICSAGVPLLTCAGHQFAARVGASFITAAGLPDLVVDSHAAYLEKLVALASDRDELLRLRGKIARNRTALPLFSSEKYTRLLEDALTSAHTRACSKRSARSFDVLLKGSET